MGRAWEKTKAGASWAAKAGALLGAVSAVAVIALATAPVTLLAGAAIVAGCAAGGALEGGFLGGLIGGMYGAVSDEPKAPHVTVIDKFSDRGHTVMHEGCAPEQNQQFQRMVNQSRTETQAQR